MKKVNLKPRMDEVQSNIPQTRNGIYSLKEVQKPIFMEKPIDSFNKGLNRKRIIAISSSGKGGTGKSTTSLMMALFYQELNKNTVLVDLDIPLGDIATMLGMSNERCISDFTDLPADLSDKKIRENMLLTYHNGLKVLPSLRDIKDLPKVNSARYIDNLLNHLQSFSTIVMDLGPNFEPMTVRALERATDILYVTDDYETTFQNIHQGKKILKQMGIDVQKIRLIINKSTSRNERAENIRATNAEKMTMIKNVYFLPLVSEMSKMVDTSNYLVLGNKNHPYKKKMYELIESLSPELFTMRNQVEQKNRTGLLSKIFGGRK